MSNSVSCHPSVLIELMGLLPFITSTGAQQKFSRITNIWGHEFEWMEQLESKLIIFLLKYISLKLSYII